MVTTVPSDTAEPPDRASRVKRTQSTVYEFEGADEKFDEALRFASEAFQEVRGQHPEAEVTNFLFWRAVDIDVTTTRLRDVLKPSKRKVYNFKMTISPTEPTR